MKNDFLISLQTCREIAGYTQEQVAEHLQLTTKTIHNYEYGNTDIPDNVICELATLYNTSALVYEYIDECTPFGKFLPTIIPTQTTGDIMYHVDKAMKVLPSTQEELHKIYDDDKIDENELMSYIETKNKIEKAAGLLLSVVACMNINIANHSSKNVDNEIIKINAKKRGEGVA